MRNLGLLILVFCAGVVRAQVTSQCLEVESILVDACSPDLKEGQNEMVRILVGPNSLAVNSIVPTWPNHAFTNWIMNAVTAQKTTELNASIQSCGFLLEPLSGFIPAGKKAILVTSWDMNTTANSFAGLTDTMYILYQNAQRGNAGHFANAGTGLRTLTINYLGCTESATYNRALLTGGDGAFVAFTQNGTDTYGNIGCTAPIVPFSIDAGPTPAPVCPGSPITLNGSVVGASTFLQWFGGQGNFSTPSGSSTQYTPTLSETGTLWLYFRVKGACPDTLKDSVQITISALPSLQINQSDFALCAGASATLTATASGSVIWSTSQTGNSINISAAGQYIAGTSNACGSASDTVNVTLSPLPTVEINQTNFSICFGASATLTAIGSGPVSWNTGQSGTSLPVSAAGQYIATVTNTCGTAADTVTVSLTALPTIQINQSAFTLCAGSSAALTATASGTVTWSTSQTGNSINISAAGQYIAGTSNSCGVAADTVNVTLSPLPTVEINQTNFSICFGASATLTAIVSGPVSWNTGQSGTSLPVSAAGQYIATVTNTCGTAADTVTVSLTALPSVFISAATDLYCGSPIVLTAQSTDPVLWNAITPGNTFTALNAGTYVVSATNNCGSASDTLVLSQGELPSAQISGPGSEAICAGDVYSISVQGTGNLVWSNGTDFSLTAPGMYTLISQTACGSDTAYFTLSVSAPEASFTATPNTGNLPLTVQTMNQSVGAVSYFWNSGSGELSVGQSPTFVYNQPGNYDLSLIVTDANGCQDSATVMITVQQNLEVFLPNVFTPNNDGVNDDYFAVVQGASEFRMMVFNRWGELLFESFSADFPWDGKTLYGSEAVSGVYYCVAFAKDYYGKTYEYGTTITVVR